MIADSSSWFLMLYTFSILSIALFIIRTYVTRYADLKANVHEIHILIELIDQSIEDDTVSKEEFVNLVKRCLALLSKLI